MGAGNERNIEKRDNGWGQRAKVTLEEDNMGQGKYRKETQKGEVQGTREVEKTRKGGGGKRKTEKRDKGWDAVGTGNRKETDGRVQ